MHEILEGLNEKQLIAAKKVVGPMMVNAGPGTGKTQLLAARITNMLKSDLQIKPSDILALTFTDAGSVAMRKRLIKFVSTEAFKVTIHTFHSFCNEVVQSSIDYFKIRNIEPATDLEIIKILYEILRGLPNEHIIKRLKGAYYVEARRLKSLFGTMKMENWDANHIKLNCQQYIRALPEDPDFIYKRGSTNKFQTIDGEEKLITKGDPNMRKINLEKEKMSKLVAAAYLIDQYNDLLAKAERYDYNDMILWVIDAFRESENILLNYQERFQYILVDEFQDTNGSQNELINLLMNYWDEPNLFVVGDPNQSIYSFQGARIQNVKDFIGLYSPQVVLLNDNYRSGQAILDAAKRVIDYNEGRLANEVDGVDESLVSRVNHDNLPMVIEYPNIAHEENAIINRIKALKDEGVSMSDIGVIYRKHRQAESIIKQLEILTIPVNVKRRVNVLDSVPVLQIIKLFEFIIASIHEVEGRNGLWFEILHYKFFGVKHKTIQELFVKRKEDIDHRASKFITKVMRIFDDLMNDYGNMSFPYFVERLLTSTGLLDYVMKHKDRVQILMYLNTFLGFIKDESMKDGSLDIPKLLQLIEEMRENALTIPVLDIHFEDEGVNMMTAHGAKGLEFKYVFMIGCQRNEWEKSRSGQGEFSLPSTLIRSIGEDQLEDNRRLFYVGMTRAKEHLQISYAAKNNDGKDLEPSQFIVETEIPIVLKNSGSMTEYLLRQVSESVVIPSIEHSYVDKVLEHYKLSVTHMNNYMECPVSFYYNYILRIPFVPNEYLIYGTAIHAALEVIYNKMKQGIRLTIEEFTQVFYDHLQKFKGYLTEDIIKRRSYLGQQTLKYYFYKIFPYTNKITLNEFRVKNIVLNGVPFKGDLDKIEFNGILVDIADYKTGNVANTKSKLRPPDEKHPWGGPLFRQLNIYRLMIENMHYKEWKFNSARIVMLDKDITTDIDAEVNYEHGLLMLKLIKEIYDKIMNHEFTEGCNKPDCKWCNFQKQQI